MNRTLILEYPEGTSFRAILGELLGIAENRPRQDLQSISSEIVPNYDEDQPGILRVQVGLS